MRALALLVVLASSPALADDVKVVDVRHTGDKDTPLIVAMHGRGDTAARFAKTLFRDAPADWKVDIISVEGNLPVGKGFGWFIWDWDRHMTLDQLAASIATADERLWPVIEHAAHGRKVIVTGFSQGGMMAYELATHHPDQVALAVPLAGYLAKGREPAKDAVLPPIYALHGVDDEVISIQYDRGSAPVLGKSLTLVELPKVMHEVTEEMAAKAIARMKQATKL